MAKKKRGKRLGLGAELKAIGCSLDVTEFRRRVIDILENHFAGFTDEQLLCRPRDSMHFCNLMRQEPTCADAPDDLILRTLVNTRKAGLR